MAATRGTLTVYSKSKETQTTRLGAVAMLAQADTWRTFTCASVEKDGRGYVSVVRDGKRIHEFVFGPEE